MISQIIDDKIDNMNIDQDNFLGRATLFMGPSALRRGTGGGATSIGVLINQW